jgi:hypothetical protein
MLNTSASIQLALQIDKIKKFFFVLALNKSGKRMIVEKIRLSKRKEN